jgi:hypothetical protein
VELCCCSTKDGFNLFCSTSFPTNSCQKKLYVFLTLCIDRYSPGDSIPLTEKLNYILFLYIGLF